jgi:hypothetical protein
MTSPKRRLIRRLGIDAPAVRTIGATGVAAAVLAALIIGSAGGQAPQGRTIVLTELPKTASFGFVDNPPKTKLTAEGEPRRFSPGDSETFSIPVADQQGKRVGRFDGQCVVVRLGGPRNHEEYCAGAYRLQDGVISIATALIGDTGNYSAAVSGGTGAYAGTRGTLESVTSNSGQTTDTLRLLP